LRPTSEEDFRRVDDELGNSGFPNTHRLNAAKLRRTHRLTICRLWNYKPVHERFSLEVLFPYDVSEMTAATYAELASLDCASSSGFLNLLTLCSALIRTALFHAESVPGVGALRGFPLPVATTAFAALYPFSLDRPLRAPPLLRSEKHSINGAFRDAAWLRDSCIREIRSRRIGVTQIRRSIPSQPFSLPRISPLKSRLLSREASSHGLSHNAERVHRCGRSPECQRTRKSLISFEISYPPWGLRPGNSTEVFNVA
jgi:hypothetical protein